MERASLVVLVILLCNTIVFNLVETEQQASQFQAPNDNTSHVDKKQREAMEVHYI